MSETHQKPVVGFVGLGAMGGGMARNLLKAGYQVALFDLSADRMKECTGPGAIHATSAADAMQRSQVLLTSLPSSEIFVSVATKELLPAIEPGKVVIDMGTVIVEEMRRLAKEFEDRGAHLIDAPVTGGSKGAANGTLRIFVGGDEQIINRYRPVLEVLAEKDQVNYCGTIGMGQVMKGVNQLAMGLVDAAYLEAIAFGTRAGLDPKLIAHAVGGNDGWRGRITQFAQMIINGRIESVGTKSGQLYYFLDEAHRRGFVMPLTMALDEFCKDGEKTVIEANRPSASFWRELHRVGRHTP